MQRITPLALLKLLDKFKNIYVQVKYDEGAYTAVEVSKEWIRKEFVSNLTDSDLLQVSNTKMNLYIGCN